MIKRLDSLVIFTSDKFHTELCAVITVKNLIQYIVAFFQKQCFQGFLRSQEPCSQIFCDYTCTDTVSFLIQFMVTFCHQKAVKFPKCHLPADSVFVDSRHIFIPDLLIRSARNINRLMGFSFPMRRYIRPFISVMPDQVIACPVGNHYFFPFKIHIFHREHHIFVKKKRAATPAHGVAAALLFFIRKHDFFQFFEGSVFSEKFIAEQPVKILKSRNFPSCTHNHADIKKICVDHHMGSVLLILSVIIRNGIKSKDIYDLSGLIVSDNLMLMDRTAVRTSISRKPVGVSSVYI